MAGLLRPEVFANALVGGSLLRQLTAVPECWLRRDPVGLRSALCAPSGTVHCAPPGERMRGRGQRTNFPSTASGKH